MPKKDNMRRKPRALRSEGKASGPGPSASPRHLWGRPLALPILLGLLGLLAAASWFAWRYLASPAAPTIHRAADQNVLLVTIDTWRADALGASGSGKVATPNLDRLASLGTRFDFAHSHAVVTLPSHASILTGLYPYQHGVRENAGFRLKPETPTLATLLHQRGMATAAFIGSFALDSRFGLNAGFDVYDERYGKSNANAGFVMPERRADAVVTEAKAWIGRQTGRWFAWVHIFDPHAPYRPPPPYDTEYRDRPYYGEVAYTDSVLGSLFDAARGSADRPTLVVVTGDHGEGLGDHGEMTHGLFAYEATLNVPLIVAQIDRNTVPWNDVRNVTGVAADLPVGGVPTRRLAPASADSTAAISHLPARHIDIVATVLAALGAQPPAALPGRDLFARDDAPRSSYFEALSASLNRGWAPLTGVLLGSEKFISLPQPEMYDLSKDAGEGTNLVDRLPERRRVLQARLEQFGASAPSARTGESADARARLQALGYVSGSAQAKERYSEADDPKNLVGVDQQLWRAIELYSRKRPREAIPIYRQIISERPTMEVAYAQLAMLEWEIGEPSEAIATLRAAVQAGVGSIAVRSRLGTYLAETGDVKEALPLLRDVTTRDGSDVDALNALGIAQARAGQALEAAATFERILRINPGNAMAVENLGSIALEAGRWDEARQYFSTALAADPQSTQAHNGLGIVELKAGNRSAAIGHWQQAVARDPENFDALYNVATELVNDGRPTEARPYLEQFARTAPPVFYARDIARVRSLLAGIGK
jgi:arylsulfatase A-like enzyme/Flp pilus assembly protein TadD